MATVRDDMDMNPMMDNPVFSTGSSVNLFCPLCHEMFVNPRLLPCLHTFCKRCLENLVVPRSCALSCPACRTDVPLTVSANDQHFCYFDHVSLNPITFESYKYLSGKGRLLRLRIAINLVSDINRHGSELTVYHHLCKGEIWSYIYCSIVLSFYLS